MSSQRDPSPVNVAQANFPRVSVGQFAERFRAEIIPLSNTFGYFCASVPVSEEVVKEYLEEPVAALPPAIAAMLPRISILLVPYLERSAEKKEAAKTAPKPRAGKVVPKSKVVPKDKLSDFVVGERPAEGKQSWTSEVTFENEKVLVFAQKEQDVAEYHYRLYRRLSALIADKWDTQSADLYKTMICQELETHVHGEVDDESWHAKQNLLRKNVHVTRESKALTDYVRQSFIDTLTLYLHGICCDIDVETGPRQLPSRYLRKRLGLLKSFYPPPNGYSVFPEDAEAKKS
jgi:hypothetical protein